MIQDLPIEIQEYIYSFFNEICITIMSHKYLIYNDECHYLICKKDKSEIILTDCIFNPNYISHSYFLNDCDYDQYLRQFPNIIV
jgi:hypothetical protein